MVNGRRYDLVIWDWNGTLLDDTQTCYQIANDMRVERGMQPMTDIAAYRAVFRFPVVEYYKKMGYTFETEPYESVSEEFVRLYAERVSRCPLQPYARETLQAVLDRGARQVLLSATGQGRLDEQVAMFSLTNCFERVIGGQNNFACGKADYACAFLAECGVPARRALFVGDTDHDFEIAASIGCGCALLVPGHQSREHLASLGAPLLDSLREMPDLL